MEDQTVDVKDAGVTLKDLIDRYGPTAKILLKEGDQVIGRLSLNPRENQPKPSKRVIGLHRGAVKHMAADFDAPPPDEFWLDGDP